jgi:hypothetical protein
MQSHDFLAGASGNRPAARANSHAFQRLPSGLRSSWPNAKIADGNLERAAAGISGEQHGKQRAD